MSVLNNYNYNYMDYHNIDLPISNRLKECRHMAGLKQFDVMLSLGLRSNDRISKWEKGTRVPNIANLFKLARLYQVSVSELYPELSDREIRSHEPPTPERQDLT